MFQHEREQRSRLEQMVEQLARQHSHLEQEAKQHEVQKQLSKKDSLTGGTWFPLELGGVHTGVNHAKTNLPCSHLTGYRVNGFASDSIR